MSEQSNSGLNLKDDLACLLSDRTFHDVTLVCADGVRVGACRAMLAARSAVFKELLFIGSEYQPVSEATISNVISPAMRVVLSFIHTETAEVSPLVAGDAYHAARFFRLPKLMKMVLDQIQGIEDLRVASSFINQDLITISPSGANMELYDALMRPFYERVLSIGDLSDLSETALHLLLAQARRSELSTPEHTLLLCVIDWAWGRGEHAPGDAERHAQLGCLEDVTDPDANSSMDMIRLENDSRTSLLKMIAHMDLALICPHRLKSITEAVDALRATSPHHRAFCHHACANTRCPPGHPSGTRQKSDHNLVAPCPGWDSRLNPDLVVSEDGAVVELRQSPSWFEATARLSTPFTTEGVGIYEWDIVIESTSKYNWSAVGLVGESFDGFGELINDTLEAAWFLVSYKGTFTIRRGESRSENLITLNATDLAPGDVVTFHLNMRENNRTCAFYINKKYYGIVWHDLPEKVYPVVSLLPETRCRFKSRAGAA